MFQIIARAAAFFQSIESMICIHLLVALDALLLEGNVSRAAMRIGLSQPATSHALQRLRDLIGDPLLVRTGARMGLRTIAVHSEADADLPFVHEAAERHR